MPDQHRHPTTVEKNIVVLVMTNRVKLVPDRLNHNSYVVRDEGPSIVFIVSLRSSAVVLAVDVDLAAIVAVVLGTTLQINNREYLQRINSDDRCP